MSNKKNTRATQEIPFPVAQDAPVTLNTRTILLAPDQRSVFVDLSNRRAEIDLALTRVGADERANWINIMTALGLPMNGTIRMNVDPNRGTLTISNATPDAADIVLDMEIPPNCEIGPDGRTLDSVEDASQ